MRDRVARQPRPWRDIGGGDARWHRPGDDRHGAGLRPCPLLAAGASRELPLVAARRHGARLALGGAQRRQPAGRRDRRRRALTSLRRPPPASMIICTIYLLEDARRALGAAPSRLTGGSRGCG